MTKEIAGIYVRLSEEDRDKQNKTDDSQSIQNQKSMLINFALEKGWEIYNIYSDDDYAGADRNRPGFRQLIEDAEQKRFNIVLCKSQSRFTRELEIVEKYIHGYFMLWGIRFVGMVDNADTNIKGNKKARQINGLVNEWYLEDLSENIKGVLTDRRMNGYHIGSTALYGYKKDPNLRGHLIPDPVAADVVHRVFELYAAGNGKIQIARILNADGIPNPAEYKNLSGITCYMKERKNSNLWRYSTVSSMLSNEMYIGNMVQGRYTNISYKTKKKRPIDKKDWIRVEGTHEPIIEPELWEKVQQIAGLRTKPFSIGTKGLFSGKVRCMYCGYGMIQKKNRQYRYLDCGTKYASKGACTGGFIPERELADMVLEELKGLINLYLDKAQAENLLKLREEKRVRVDEMKKQLRQYRRKNADLKKGLGSLYLDKAKGIISEQEYLEYAESFHAEQEKYLVMIDDIEKRIEQESNIITNRDTKSEILEKYINIKELNYDIILTLIDYIEIGKRNNKNEDVPIKIHWSF